MGAQSEERASQTETSFSEERLQRFVDKYQGNEEDIARYKRYRLYRQLSSQYGWIPLVIALVLALTLSFTNIENAALGYFTLGLFVLGIFTTLGGDVLRFALWRSDLTQEIVAYHTIISAIEPYRRRGTDASKTVLKNLEDASSLLEDAEVEYISKRRRDDIRDYVSALENAQDLERSLERTFKIFISEVLDYVVFEDVTDLEKTSKSIITEETETPLKQGVKEDIKHILSPILTGKGLVISVALLASVITVGVFNRPTSVGLSILAVILALSDLLLRHRDN